MLYSGTDPASYITEHTLVYLARFSQLSFERRMDLASSITPVGAYHFIHYSKTVQIPIEKEVIQLSSREIAESLPFQ